VTKIKEMIKNTRRRMYQGALKLLVILIDGNCQSGSRCFGIS